MSIPKYDYFENKTLTRSSEFLNDMKRYLLDRQDRQDRQARRDYRHRQDRQDNSPFDAKRRIYRSDLLDRQDRQDHQGRWIPSTCGYLKHNIYVCSDTVLYGNKLCGYHHKIVTFKNHLDTLYPGDHDLKNIMLDKYIKEL